MQWIRIEMPVEMRETERNEIKRGEWLDAERTREKEIEGKNLRS
jgi:hypothetical protein